MVTPGMEEVERWSGFKVWLFSLFNRTPQSNLAAVDWLSLGPEDRFLDVGCGLGAALEYALSTGADVAGLDPSPAMVARAGSRVPEAEVEVGSAEAIPFADGHFTSVMAVSTYHHWADPDAGLAEMRRVLVPAGRVLIVERRLKKGRGHGIDRGGADRLSAALIDRGFSSSQIEERRVGRADYLAISAENAG